MTSSDREIPAALSASDALDEGEVRDTLPSPEPASNAPAVAAGARADDASERDAPDTLPTPPPTPDMAVDPVTIPPDGAPPRFEA
jgi:hypothetical protein